MIESISVAAGGWRRRVVGGDIPRRRRVPLMMLHRRRLPRRRRRPFFAGFFLSFLGSVTCIARGGRDQGEEGHGRLQAAPRHADRDQGHAAEPPHVRVIRRLVSLALPRIRDFRGVSPKAFDGRGNYTLGLKEQLKFPEIQYDEVASIHGMDITIVTTARVRTTKENPCSPSWACRFGRPKH